MAGDFGEVLSKLRWAKHHIAQLDVAVSDYVDQRPYMAKVEDKPDAEAYKVVAHLRSRPPASIAHIVGDVLNALDGTLDYLAAQLVIREGFPPDIRTKFPLKLPHKDGSEPPVNIYRAGKGGRGKVPVIEDAAVLAALRQIQPFRLSEEVDREIHPLLVIRRLNGEAKHRHPAIVTTSIYEGHHTYDMSNAFGDELGGAKVSMTTVNSGLLHDGGEMGWVPYSWAPENGLEEDDDFATVVSLEGWEWVPDSTTPYPAPRMLQDVHGFIERSILPLFAQFF